MNKNKPKTFWIAAIVLLVIIVCTLGYSKLNSKITSEATEECVDVANPNEISPFEATIENKDNRPSNAPEGMVWIPGGEFSMGSNVKDESLCSIKGVTSDANPIHRVYVDGYWMDETEVTNKQFAQFVKETGYVTYAEKKPTLEEFPNASLENLITGSAVFTPTQGQVSLNDFFQWWSFVPNADWRHPTGLNSSIKGKDNYPVVQIAYEDALAYAKWAGKRLPTEAEWEFAARGGKTGNLYSWGNTLKVKGKFQANIYEGNFPVANGDTGEDGYVGIAPTGQYDANGYGLYDMGGNVWEWVSDWYDREYYSTLAATNSISRNPQGPAQYNDPTDPLAPKRVHRGGSFLCTDQYCTRYMVGTRGKGEANSPANHLGFRCVK